MKWLRALLGGLFWLARGLGFGRGEGGCPHRKPGDGEEPAAGGHNRRHEPGRNGTPDVPDHKEKT